MIDPHKEEAVTVTRFVLDDTQKLTQNKKKKKKKALYTQFNMAFCNMAKYYSLKQTSPHRGEKEFCSQIKSITGNK